jgi:ParB family chromosome partitioning protein
MTLDIQALLAHAGLAGLQRLPLTRIAPNPDNPRRDFDAIELAALSASIVERGLLQPISVFPADTAGVHVIRFGERRYRAALAAGLTEIEAIIVDPPEPATQLVDQVIENDQRVDLTTQEMADAIAALSATGMTKTAIAARMGRPAATISLYAAVEDMPPALRGMANEVSIRALHDLFRLWRKAPEAVSRFLDEVPVEKIDRPAVARLAGQLQAPSAVTTPEPLHAISPTPEPVRRADAGPRPGTAEQTMCELGRVRIAVGEKNGTLLFTASPVDGELSVRLDGEDVARTVPSAELRILSASQ